jgi:fluoroquinolone resistance protein
MSVAGTISKRGTLNAKRVTMSRKFIEGTELEGETLNEPSLEDLTLDQKVFINCTFVNANWMEATLRRCLFENCVFRGCDMTMMSPYDTSFREVRFERCKLMGIDWTKAHQLTFQADFDECALNHCSFDGMPLRELSITNCRALEVVFTEADLTGADLSGTDLSGSVFLHTILEQVDLSSASHYTIDPITNKLRDTKLSLEGALRSLALLGVRVPSVEASG